MRRGVLILVFVLGAIASMSCVVSTQDGEPNGANAPLPDVMAWHFDTGFNKAMVAGRLLLPAIAGLVVFAMAGSKGKGTSLVIAVPLFVAGAWWSRQGWSQVKGYHVEVDKERLRVEVPPDKPREVLFSDIDSMAGEYEVHDASIDGKSRQPKSYTDSLRQLKEYKSLSIRLTDGSTLDIDVSRLSVEQRGTLIRAIQERANLAEGAAQSR